MLELPQYIAFLAPEDSAPEPVQMQGEIREINKPVISSQAWLEPQYSPSLMVQPEEKANFANNNRGWSFDDTVASEAEQESLDGFYHHRHGYGNVSSRSDRNKVRSIYASVDADLFRHERTPLNTSAVAWLGPASITGPMGWSAPLGVASAKSFAKKKQRKQKTLIPTTMMVRELPSDYSRDKLIELMDLHNFKGFYDLVYLPVDFQRMQGFGYAFVNFITREQAERFQAHFTGFCDWDTPSDLVCEVVWGTTYQGLQNHVERFRNSPVMHASVPDEFRPALFSRGVRVPFPKPSLPPKVPRHRRSRPGGLSV